jgi:hypothetical protein
LVYHDHVICLRHGVRSGRALPCPAGLHQREVTPEPRRRREQAEFRRAELARPYDLPPVRARPSRGRRSAELEHGLLDQPVLEGEAESAELAQRRRRDLDPDLLAQLPRGRARAGSRRPPLRRPAGPAACRGTSSARRGAALRARRPRRRPRLAAAAAATTRARSGVRVDSRAATAGLASGRLLPRRPCRCPPVSPFDLARWSSFTTIPLWPYAMNKVCPDPAFRGEWRREGKEGTTRCRAPCRR